MSLFFFAFLFNLKTSAAEVNINSTWQSKALVSIQQLQGAELWVGGSVGVVTAQGDASTEFSGEATLGSGLKPDQDSIFEIG